MPEDPSTTDPGGTPDQPETTDALNALTGALTHMTRSSDEGHQKTHTDLQDLKRTVSEKLDEVVQAIRNPSGGETEPADTEPEPDESDVDGNDTRGDGPPADNGSDRDQDDQHPAPDAAARPPVRARRRTRRVEPVSPEEDDDGWWKDKMNYIITCGGCMGVVVFFGIVGGLTYMTYKRKSPPTIEEIETVVAEKNKELKNSEITPLRNSVDSGFSKVQGEINKLQGRVNEVATSTAATRSDVNALQGQTGQVENRLERVETRITTNQRNADLLRRINVQSGVLERRINNIAHFSVEVCELRLQWDDRFKEELMVMVNPDGVTTRNVVMKKGPALAVWGERLSAARQQRALQNLLEQVRGGQSSRAEIQAFFDRSPDLRPYQNEFFDLQSNVKKSLR